MRAPRDELISAACLLAGGVTGRLASRQDTVPPPNPRIVMLRRLALGDVLQSTAALAALRRRYPLAAIDYATSPYAAAALEGNPDVSNLIPPTLAALRAGQYDVAVVLERSPLAGMLAWLAGIPLRVGPNSGGRGFACNLPVAVRPERSEAELMLDCAAALDVSVEDAGPRFLPGADAQARVAALLGSQHRWLAVAPGGGLNPGMHLVSKRWLPERFAAVASALAASDGLRPVLVGGPDDVPVCSAVEWLAKAPVVNLCGHTSFQEMGAVIQAAELFVGNDSAPLHLAAAVGTPHVGIYGPSDPVRHRPLGAGEVVAAPISRKLYEAGFADVDCIGQVSVDDVLAACRRVLAARALSAA
ncbi:MAG TPA: glycosyltransferase family 9 protein [Chloroflexota bacterium]|nr:glycosyltransferase family 9 protein [Chloroflexota bacterium]